MFFILEIPGRTGNFVQKAFSLENRPIRLLFNAPQRLVCRRSQHASNKASLNKFRFFARRLCLIYVLAPFTFFAGFSSTNKHFRIVATPSSRVNHDLFENIHLANSHQTSRAVYLFCCKNSMGKLSYGRKHAELATLKKARNISKQQADLPNWKSSPQNFQAIHHLGIEFFLNFSSTSMV